MTIGDNIKKYRKQNKLTQKELGEKIGKSTITIRKYESNDISPSLKALKDISEQLNVNLSDLTSIDDNFFELTDAHNVDRDELLRSLTSTNPLKNFGCCDLSNCTYDELKTIKNKFLYKNELDNKILLNSKINARDLELLYLSKIDDLKSIIDSNEKYINKLEKMIDLQNNFINKFIKTSGGDTDGE